MGFLPVGGTVASAIWAMMAAAVLPLIWSYVAKLGGGFGWADNASPRVFLAQLQGLPARAHAAQQNSFETLPVFLAAVIVAMLFFVPQLVINQLAWLYVLLRIGYGAAYLANLPTLRAILWFTSFLCPMFLFYLAIRLTF